MNSQETIAAPITASGQAGVTVIRTSGSLTREILHSLTDSAAEIIENPRELKLARVLDSRTTLDRALVVYFPGPGSFTGCLLYTSPSPRDQRGSRMPSSA